MTFPHGEGADPPRPQHRFVCDLTALLPWGPVWGMRPYARRRQGAEKQNRGLGTRRELRGGCHSAPTQGRRMPAAHFLSEGHQGQIPVNTHTPSSD